MHFKSLHGWLQWQETLHSKQIDLGLERVFKVFQLLEKPVNRPLTITVGGTNGKGSSVAFLDAILRQSGYRVGSYTSPHLQRYNERIRINGIVVRDELICQAFERIEAVRGTTSLSYFEFCTLAALDIFARAALDVQLLEVGLGGRLDAVNIFDADVALIPSIGIDHSDWLGDTRELIAREKMGIFRSRRPAVVGDIDPPAIMETYSRELHTPLYLVGKDFSYKKNDDDWTWSNDTDTLTHLPHPNLLGQHQMGNAAAVLQVLSLLSPRLPLTEQAIVDGLRQVQLPGRFQVIDGTPLILLDVGHNPLSADILRDYLISSFPDKKIHLIFNMMKDKDFVGVGQRLKSIVSHWYIAPLDNPRCADVEQVLTELNNCSIENVFSGFTSFDETLAAAQDNSQSQDLIVIFGSFFLVSAFLSKRSGQEV
jgi:dihydrofolate synthase/folylpolyglutamate synthase